jgi:uncharacterized 2Fe-2S/4Fe-4S cluster protein (DUF4445 family)
MSADHTREAARSESAAAAGFGVAVDLGTTHVRAALWDRTHDQNIRGALVANPQARFGKDVLARLAAAAESTSHAGEISALAQDAIGAGIREVCAGAGIPTSTVHDVAIVGNTAMLALLTQEGYADLLNPDTWNREIECTFDNPADVCSSWGLGADCHIEVVQPLAGFVGSDLLAGVLAEKLEENPAGSLLIDFGANSEIALWDGTQLWATSTAGGPAFEWCGIHGGMAAQPGAIWRMKRASSTLGLESEVIGNGEPKGICASGLVDAIAYLTESGTLSIAGQPAGSARGKNHIPLTDEESVFIDRRTVDAFQRAKAGVAAATQCLVANAGMMVTDIERVCVSGEFGSSLDIHNASSIGLLPPVELDRVELCGNTALAGCGLILRGKADTGPLRRGNVKVVNMSYQPEYEEVFIDNLFLRPWGNGPRLSAEPVDSHA